ncbi:hypothetical protein FACS189421_06890 [Bacteroidia bacterium]|nr:hypothetical protein FACS189421_06890 [Bacteroidia bacterium]
MFDKVDLIVAPDRLEITEIDLSQVQVTGTESYLYNTEPPKPAPAPEPKKPELPKPEPKKPEPVQSGDDTAKKPVEQPTIITDDAEKKDSANQKSEVAAKSDSAKTDEIRNPKSRTVVRVNRETAPLNRTMTISVVDALRVALTRCWVIDRNRPDISDIRAVTHLTMRPNGMVADMWFEEESRAQTDSGYFYVFETIRTAVAACQPFSMLPESEFDEWKEIQLTFYPSTNTIM